MTILDLFSTEFPSRTRAYYETAIMEGRITVNGAKVSPDFKLKQSSKLCHSLLRIELPVRDEPVSIIHCDDNLVVANKPASIPIHKTGSYFKNTLLYILEHERKMGKLYANNRLDRMTSGIILLSRSPQAAKKMSQVLSERKVEKLYLAKTAGNFPQGKISLESLVKPKDIRDSKKDLDSNGAAADENGKKEPKNEAGEGNEQREGKKSSQSFFEKIAYDEKSDTSLVLCRPQTGRTHQLRIHLEELGHPILNDPIYNGRSSSNSSSSSSNNNSNLKKRKNPNDDEEEEDDEDEFQHIDPSTISDPEKEKKLMRPDPDSLVLCLHAWIYRLKSSESSEANWSYESDCFPSWISKEMKQALVGIL